MGNKISRYNSVTYVKAEDSVSFNENVNISQQNTSGQQFFDIESADTQNISEHSSSGRPVTISLCTQNLNEDIISLREKGFEIDLKTGYIGNGAYGTVFKGQYRIDENTKQVKDTKDRLLKGIIDGQKFAAKYIAFDPDLDISYDDRQYLEIEKHVLTKLKHKNIVKIDTIANMGNLQKIEFKNNKGYYFDSPDRIFLIMECADLGDLREFLLNLEDKLQESVGLSIYKQLLIGLKYLHDMNVIHADIKRRNILMFTENNELVPKFADFGISILTVEDFTQEKGINKTEYYKLMIQTDCRDLSDCLLGIENRTNWGPNMKKLIMRITNKTRKTENLVSLFQRFEEFLLQ